MFERDFPVGHGGGWLVSDRKSLIVFPRLLHPHYRLGSIGSGYIRARISLLHPGYTVYVSDYLPHLLPLIPCILVGDIADYDARPSLR